LASKIGVGKCWAFNDDEEPSYPTIELTVSSADRKATISPKVDTGFNGSLALGREAVRKMRLTARGTVLIKAATGHSEVPVYAVKIDQPDLALTFTTLAIGTERSLAGRQLLENRTWLLDCKGRRFCIATPTSAAKKHTGRSREEKYEQT
jgi:predicted aspartyl protease